MNVPPPYPPEAKVEPQPHVPNYMTWAIVATIASAMVCCLSCVSFPGIATGIVAIVFAGKVNSLLAAGDVAGARRASHTAKIWCWVTLGIIVLSLVVATIFILTGGWAEQMQELQRAIEQAQQR